MTTLRTIRPERVFRCVGCGLPRYLLSRSCANCDRLARRHYLWGA